MIVDFRLQIEKPWVDRRLSINNHQSEINNLKSEIVFLYSFITASMVE